MSIANIGDEVTNSDFLCFCGLVVSWLLGIAVNSLHHTIAIDSFAEVFQALLTNNMYKTESLLTDLHPMQKEPSKRPKAVCFTSVGRGLLSNITTKYIQLSHYD